MIVSRAEFLSLVLGALPLGLAAQGVDGDRIDAVLREYDSQGVHRTGTEVDRRSGDWLRDRAKDAGADAVLEPFQLDRVDVRAAHVEIDGRRVEGLPLFDGAFTDARGVSGSLGPSGSRAEIALVTFDAAATFSEGRGIADLRRSGAHKAIVVVAGGARGGLAPTNAASFAAPYGCPVLQVGPDAADLLQARARTGGAITVVAHAERTRATASNVIAHAGGGPSAAAPLVVMTPRSGWWQCASERGGGIACWLEAIRGVSASGPRRPVIFLASSGHELGHYGLDQFLHKRPALVTRASAWIHLGANIGAAGGRMRIQASDDEIEARALTALREAGAVVADRVPRGTVPAGEARNIHVGGGRYVSLLGSSPVFHSRADRYPSAVDVPAVSRFARALSSLAVALARG